MRAERGLTLIELMVALTAFGLAAMALGSWRDPERLEITHLPSLTILSRRPNLRVMNDGETLILPPPLKYRLRPRALRVLALPAEAAA